MLRAHTANLAVEKGVNIHQTLVKVVMKCRQENILASFVFDWQPRSGHWKLNKYLQRSNGRFGQAVPLPGSSPISRGKVRGTQYCAPAYTARQVARAILEEACDIPNINSWAIAAIVKAKRIYIRHPPYSHYRAIRRELMRHLATSRAVKMAALGGYTQLLRDVGHKVKVFTLNGAEMKEQRIKAAHHIFQQCKSARSVPAEMEFDCEVVDCSDIEEGGKYYSGFIFVPSVA